MSQLDINVSTQPDELEQDAKKMLEQIRSTRRKLDAGELCEAELAQWKSPLVALYSVETMLILIDRIEDLQAHIKVLQQQVVEARENLGLINEVLFESLDDCAGDDQGTAALPDESRSSDLKH